MNLGFAFIAARVVSFIVDMVKSGVQGNIAASNAAAEFDYFRNIEDGDFMSMALELQKQVPIYDYKKWFYVLKQLKEYGLINSPRPGGQPIIPPVITPPNGNAQESRESDFSKYLPWAAVGLFLIFIIRR